MEIRNKSNAHLINQAMNLLENPGYVSFGSTDDEQFELEQNGYHQGEPMSKKSKFGEKLMSLVDHCMDPDVDRDEALASAVDSLSADEYRVYVDAVRFSRLQSAKSTETIVLDEGDDIRNPEVMSADFIVNNWSQDKIEEAFPAGNFLFHGTNTIAASSIINTGFIMSANTKAQKSVGIYNDQIHQSKGGDIGISWSLNSVWALPTDLNHPAGFIVSPINVEDESMQFIVPTVACDFEVQSIHSDVKDIDQLKQLDFQNRMWSAAAGAVQQLQEMPIEYTANNPIINSIRLEIAKIMESDVEFYHFSGGLTRFTEAATTENIHPLSILLFSLLESGDSNLTIDEILDVRNGYRLRQQLLDVFTDDLLGDEFRQVGATMDYAVGHTKEVKMPVSRMIFVCNETDAPFWIERFKRSVNPPKGILIINGKKVRVPNFVIERNGGDHGELTEEIRKVIPSTDETTRWEDSFDEDIIGWDDRPKGNEHLLLFSQTLRAKSLKFKK